MGVDSIGRFRMGVVCSRPFKRAKRIAAEAFSNSATMAQADVEGSYYQRHDLRISTRARSGC